MLSNISGHTFIKKRRKTGVGGGGGGGVEHGGCGVGENGGLFMRGGIGHV